MMGLKIQNGLYILTVGDSGNRVTVGVGVAEGGNAIMLTHDQTRELRDKLSEMIEKGRE